MEELQFGQFGLSVVLSVIVGLIFKAIGGEEVSDTLKTRVMIGVALGLGLLGVAYQGLAWSVVNVTNCLLDGIVAAAAASGLYSWMSKERKAKIKTNLLAYALLLWTFGWTGMMAIQGCATTQQTVPPALEDPAVQDLAIKLTARQLGYRLGQNNPARIDEFIGYADAFGQAGCDPAKLFVALLEKIKLPVNTYPMLEADLRDLMAAFKFEVNVDTVLTARQQQMILIGVAAFREGLMFAKGGK